MSTNPTRSSSSASSANPQPVLVSAAEEPIPAALTAISGPHARRPSPTEAFLSRYESALKCLKDVSVDLSRARRLLHAALQEDPRALKTGGCAAQLQKARFLYAKMCLHGQGGPIEEERGLIYLKTASMDKHADATFQWALHLLKSNPEKAKKLMAIASSQDSPHAKIHLAFFSLDEEPKRAESLIEEAQKLGYPSPSYALARLLVKKDLREKALPWIKKAAEQSNPDAIYDSAQSIREVDLMRYGQQIEFSADLGCSEAQFEMGMQFAGLAEEVWIEDANYEQARTFLLKAATQNHPGALSALASLYQSGEGVDVDYAIARQLYIKAIAAAKLSRKSPLFAAPFDQAQTFRALADMTRDGAGCEPDPALALEFLRRS